MKPDTMDIILNSHPAQPLTVSSCIDPVGIVEGILSGAFVSLFSDEEARHKFGYHQISPCTHKGGLPGWYLWFMGTQGAFQLETKGIISPAGTECPSAEDTTIGVEMIIRYYPRVGEKIFKRFSCFERLVRLSPLFDHTGTPTPEGAERIHPSQFITGYLNIRTNVSRSYLNLECCAPQRWTDYRMDGLSLKDEEQGEVEVVPPGGRDRYVPGWNLSRRLYDKLLWGLGYVFKMSPTAVFLSRENGFAFYIDRENNIEKRLDTKSAQYCMAACFALPSGGTADSSIDRHLEQTRARLSSNKSKWMEIDKMPAVKVPWVNPDWWQSKDMKFCATVGYHCCSHDH